MEKKRDRGGIADGSVRRLAPTTNVCDCHPEIRKYIRGVGHRGVTIGATPVWIRYEKIGPRQFKRHIGPTEEAVKAPAGNP